MLIYYTAALHVICSFHLSQTAAMHLPPVTPYQTNMENTSIKSIIEGLGFVYESYDVTTQDGYILNLNRMINPKKIRERDKGTPVLLVNGMQMYSESWFLQYQPQNNILAYLLRGYDIWLGDQRGSVRSRRHVNMSDETYDFWDFSFHETGVYDLPAFIDFILNTTAHEKVVYTGLSLGGPFYYVLCAEKPEYQEKLYGAILFQPSAAPKMSELRVGTKLSLDIIYAQMHLQRTLGIGRSILNVKHQKKLAYLLCQVPPFAVMSSVTKFSTGEGCQYDHRSFCAQAATSLGGSSVRTVIHTFQLFKNGGKFTKYDWGAEENMKRYGTVSPPEYDVSKIRVFAAIYVSDIDEYAPTRMVVQEFFRKFSGNKYICKYPDVCHMFTMYDPRVGPFVEDSAEVLDSITGRSNSTKMHSKTCQIDVSKIAIPRNQNLIAQTKDFIAELLPGFIAQHLD